LSIKTTSENLDTKTESQTPRQVDKKPITSKASIKNPAQMIKAINEIPHPISVKNSVEVNKNVMNNNISSNINVNKNPITTKNSISNKNPFVNSNNSNLSSQKLSMNAAQLLNKFPIPMSTDNKPKEEVKKSPIMKQGSINKNNTVKEETKKPSVDNPNPKTEASNKNEFKNKLEGLTKGLENRNMVPGAFRMIVPSTAENKIPPVEKVSSSANNDNTDNVADIIVAKEVRKTKVHKKTIAKF